MWDYELSDRDDLAIPVCRESGDRLVSGFYG